MSGTRLAPGHWNRRPHGRRLIRHATLGQNDGASVNNTYVHDVLGRCEVIAGADGAELERRDYDAVGRLSHRYLATTEPRAELADVASVITYGYDELGRLRSAEQCSRARPRFTPS
jgi:hypothetical protein